MKFTSTILSIVFAAAGLVPLVTAAAADSERSNRVYYCKTENFENECASQRFTDNGCTNVEEKFDNQIMSFTALTNVNCLLFEDKECKGEHKNIGSDRLPTLKRFRGLSSFKCEDQTD